MSHSTSPAPGTAAGARPDAADAEPDQPGGDPRLLQAALDALPQRVFWRDRDGRYLGCNRAFAEAAGVGRPEQVVGRTDAELPWPDGVVRALRADDAALLSGAESERHAVEPTGTARTGERWLEIRKTPLRNAAGAIVGVVGVLVDGTERRIAEARLRTQEAALQRRNRTEALGALTGGLARQFHRLQETIARHAAAASKTARRIVEPGLTEDLRQIGAAAEQASGLTRRLVDFDRLQTAAPTTLDPREEIAELVSLIRPLFGDEIDLRLDEAHEPPGPVHADRGELQQALLNLCLNARDAMEPRGGGRLTLAARRVPAPPADDRAGDYVRFEVTDTGPGIPEAIRDQVFAPLVTTKPPGSGAGLGMAVVRGVAERHRGRVTLDSTARGTNVGLELPAADSPSPRTHAAPLPHSSPQTPSTPQRPTTDDRGGERPPIRALVVDDHLSVRLVTAWGLKKQGYECRTAENGRQAMELLDGGFDCDVIVTDLSMPEMNGRTLCLKLLDRPDRPGLIVLSGSLDARLHEGLVDLGVDRLFFKPMGYRELGRAVAEVVAERAAAQSA